MTPLMERLMGSLRDVWRALLCCIPAPVRRRLRERYDVLRERLHFLVVWIFLYAIGLHVIWAFGIASSGDNRLLVPSIVKLSDIWPDHDTLAGVLLAASVLATAALFIRNKWAFGLLIGFQQFLLLASAWGSGQLIYDDLRGHHPSVVALPSDWHLALITQAPNIVAALCHSGGILQHYWRMRVRRYMIEGRELRV